MADQNPLDIPSRIARTPDVEDLLRLFNSPGAEPQPYLRRNLQERHPSTGEWILDEPEPQQWMQGEIPRLWMYGFLGCGKTVLAAVIVERLLQQAHQDPMHAVCYHFCDILNPFTVQPMRIITSLVTQLAQQNAAAFSELSDCIRTGSLPKNDPFEDPDGNIEGPFLYRGGHSLVSLFRSMAKYYSRVTVVVNAIDQCVDEEEDMTNEAVDMVSALTLGPESNVRVLFLTRNTDDQRELCIASRSQPFAVTGRSDDVCLAMRAKIDRKLSQGAEYLSDESLRSRLANFLGESCRGSWVWANTELDYQCQLLSEGHQANLEDRSANIFPYAHVFDRVTAQGSSRSANILEQTLKWIWVGTKMPQIQLKTSEMCEALSLVLRRDDTLTQNVYEGEVLAVCGPLLRKSKDGEKLEFSHYSLQGYLERVMAEERPDLIRFQVEDDASDELFQLGRLCLGFLARPELAVDPSSAPDEDERLESRDVEHPFYGYAAENWSKLLRGNCDMISLLLPLFEAGSGVFKSWFFAYCRRTLPDFPVQAATLACALNNNSLSPLHVAAAEGLQELCFTLGRYNEPMTNKPSPYGTPLLCALMGIGSFASQDKPFGWKVIHPHPSSWHRVRTVQCFLDDLYADCRAVQTRHGAPVSLAATALFTCIYINNWPLFVAIVRQGAPLDEGLVEMLRTRSYMIHPQSLDVRPLEEPVYGNLAETLNWLFNFLIDWTFSVPEAGQPADSIKDQVYAAVWANVLRDGLRCGQLDNKKPLAAVFGDDFDDLVLRTVQQGRVHHLRRLLQDPRWNSGVRDSDGRNLVEVARGKGHEQILELLES